MGFIRHNNAIKEFYHNLDIILLQDKIKAQKVVIFGTSKIAGMIIAYLKDHQINIDAIVDNDRTRQGKTVFGLSVYSPQKYVKEYGTESIFLIASAYQVEMSKQLNELGVKPDNIIKVIDLPKLMNDYSFVNRTGKKEMTNADIKKHQLKILKHLKEVCDRHNLKYYLSAGTLLGAVRHKGFIPWDDDIDVYVELKDLKKLVDIMKKDPDYSLISFADPEVDYYDEISLLVDNHTICDTNHFPMQLSAGISIDIFALSGIPTDENERVEYVNTVRRLDQERWNKLYSVEECRKATNQLVEYLEKYDYDKCSHVGCIMTPYFLREMFSKEVFAEGTQLEFEGIMFRAPQKYEIYLKQIYGDYMQLPPVEKRVAHHFFKAYYEK